MSEKPPRYTFSNVDGVMKDDGTSISIGFTGEHVDISFDYRDASGQWYSVVAKGYRTKKEEVKE